MAILGCKINRRLYRLPEAQREPSPHLFETPTTDELLFNCAYFAQLQNKLRPTSATASMNLAWVATEKQKYYEMHEWYKESVKRADAEGNDGGRFWAVACILLQRVSSEVRFCPCLIPSTRAARSFKSGIWIPLPRASQVWMSLSKCA